jgi:hypothetical protein
LYLPWKYEDRKFAEQKIDRQGGKSNLFALIGLEKNGGVARVVVPNVGWLLILYVGSGAAWASHWQTYLGRAELGNNIEFTMVCEHKPEPRLVAGRRRDVLEMKRLWERYRENDSRGLGAMSSPYWPG